MSPVCLNVIMIRTASSTCGAEFVSDFPRKARIDGMEMMDDCRDEERAKEARQEGVQANHKTTNDASRAQDRSDRTRDRRSGLCG